MNSIWKVRAYEKKTGYMSVIAVCSLKEACEKALELEKQKYVVQEIVREIL